MGITRRVLALSLSMCGSLGAPASAQTPTGAARWAIDVGTGLEPSVNGNVNSGAIGVYQGQTTAILPNSYGDVYGTGVEFRFGGAYALNHNTELRGMFIRQSADADLVRLGDFGQSSLYGQYSDYKSFGLDVGLRIVRRFDPEPRHVQRGQENERQRRRASQAAPRPRAENCIFYIFRM